MKTALFPLLLLQFATAGDRLTGRWQSTASPDGTVAEVLFGDDQTFQASFSTGGSIAGSYAVTDSVFTISDGSCAGTGVYKLNFFSNGDSVRFRLVNDGCGRRALRIDGVLLGRLRP